MKTQAKAIAAAVVVIIFWIINGISTGDWSSTDTVQAALTVILTYIVVWGVPNSKVD